MNVYDSNKIKDLFHNKGYSATSDIDQADIIVLNTCHIREKAAEKVYSDIGRITKKRSKANLKDPKLERYIEAMHKAIFEGILLTEKRKAKPINFFEPYTCFQK